MIDAILDSLDEWRGCVLPVLALLFFAALLGWTVAMAVEETRTERACMERGFPGASVTWNFDAYCIRRVNQTDSVVALRKLK